MVLQSVLAPAAPDMGIDANALAEVERLFRAQISPLRLHPGAALAVYRHGHVVLDLTAGLADTQRGEPIRPDTMFYLFSGTKPFASVALLQQIERGQAGLDDPVADHWPAFGQHGKERVTLRHVLSHRGGFPVTPTELTPERWGDWDGAIRAIAEMPLGYEPGMVSAYHRLTQQWVCAEVVCRLTGRPYPDYLRAEITGPLGMVDTYVGLPTALEHRVAKLHATDGTDEAGAEVVRTVNGLPLHRMVAPAASGVSTARDMARFYAALAAGGELDGVRILRRETVDRALGIEVDDETDRTFDVTVRRGLGFELGGLAGMKRLWAGTASTSQTFWHGGFGTSVCWGDRDLNVAMAFLTNGVRRDEAGAEARRNLSDAVRAVGQ